MAITNEDSAQSLPLGSATSSLSVTISDASLKAFGCIPSCFGARKPAMMGLRAAAMEQAFRTMGTTVTTGQHEPWIDESSKEVIWSTPRIRAYQAVNSKAMNALMMAITVLSTVLIIYETDGEASCYPTYATNMSECPTSTENRPWLNTINWIILIAFTSEILLKIYALRCNYLESKMNVMDLFVCIADCTVQIIGSVIRIKWFRIFRVFRLCRAARIVKGIPELNALTMGIEGCLRTTFFGTGLLLLLLIFCSICLVQLVHPVTSRLNVDGCERCSRGYASVMAATLTLFQSIVAGIKF